MDDKQQQVDKIFDTWNRGDLSDETAVEQLAAIIEATSNDETLLLANASIETIKAHR